MNARPTTFQRFNLIGGDAFGSIFVQDFLDLSLAENRLGLIGRERNELQDIVFLWSGDFQNGRLTWEIQKKETGQPCLEGLKMDSGKEVFDFCFCLQQKKTDLF